MANRLTRVLLFTNENHTLELEGYKSSMVSMAFDIVRYLGQEFNFACAVNCDAAARQVRQVRTSAKFE